MKNLSKIKKILFLFLGVFLFFVILHIIFPLRKNISYSKTVMDNKGEIIHAFLSDDDKWRMFTEIDEISPELNKAIIFKEDKYFYYHFGINPIAIVRAFYNNTIQGKRTSGASTITMQVARLLYPNKRTYWHKISEIFRAFQLECTYSKTEILQLYLNLVPYGSNIEGVKSAAVLYLQKQPNHLSLAEITALSIIPNRPTSLVPGKNNQKIEQERNKWLIRFQKANLFDQVTLNDALTESFEAKRHEAPKKAPHFSLRMKKKYAEQINIKTTLNTQLQTKTQAVLSDYMQNFRNENIHNAAVLVIDNKTMNVVTYIGSNDFYDAFHSGQVDGVNAIRQPGSTLKPLLYGLAIDKGLVTPKSVLSDVPINYNGYSPQNYNKEYNGYVSIAYALEQSLNVPAVKILDELGVKPFISSLIDCDFLSVERKKDDLGLSVVLGGCGTTLQELTTLYSAFANNGQFQAIRFLSDPNESNKKPKKILSNESNFMISEMMTQLQRPDLPNYWQNTQNLPLIAWKTGTSYGRKDAWAIGFNANYTVGVWLGNFDSEGVPELTGTSHATPILFDIFKAIDSKHSRSWLKKPKTLDIRMVCSASGQIPSENCTDIIFDYFIPLTSSNATCTHLSNVYLSANDSMSYCLDCLPESGYKTKWLPNHTAEMIAFFEFEHIGYEKTPPHNAKCMHLHLEGAPIISSPKNGVVYYLDKNNVEEIELKCQANQDASKVFWYVDDIFYKESKPTESVFIKAKPGKIKISCSDDLGRNTNAWFEVKYIDF